MAAIVQLMIFGVATYWVYTYGIARTFAQVFIPAVLFFFLIPQLKVPALPDLFCFSSVGYPVLILAYHRWHEVQRVKWNLLDFFVAMMLITPTISVMLNNTLWDGIGISGELFFKWLMPYLMARIAFLDADARRYMLKTICICTIILGCLAAVEARLKPYMVSRALEKLNLNSALYGNDEVFTRFGLMRAQVTFGHSIDLGICGVILGGLIITLLPITGRKWNEPQIMCGIFGAGAMVIGAVSFTGIIAMCMAFVFLILFSSQSVGKYLVIPAILTLTLGLTGYMNHMIEKHIPDERPDDEVEASVWARVKVAQDSWAFAQNSGVFGQGVRLDTKGMGTGQGSIDNSYMLFVMQFGWIYLFQWILLALIVGWSGTKALSRAITASERIPVAATMGGIVAVFGAMFTVYFGFVYCMMILCFFGVLSSMNQLLTNRVPYMPTQPIPYAMPGERGFQATGRRAG